MSDNTTMKQLMDDTNISKNILKEMTVEELNDYLLFENGLALEYLEKSNQTKEMVKNAVTQNGLALKYANKKFHTKEIAKIAVSQNYEAIDLLSDKLKSRELWYIVAEKGGINKIPKDIRDQKMYELALAYDPKCAKYLPEQYRNITVFSKALDKGVENILYFPPLTETKYIKIVNKYPSAIIYFDKVNITRFRSGLYNRSLLAAVQSDPTILKDISWDQQTYEACAYVIDELSCANPEVIKWVNLTYLWSSDNREGLLARAANIDPTVLLNVPIVLWNLDAIKVAVKKDPTIAYSIAYRIAGAESDGNCYPDFFNNDDFWKCLVEAYPASIAPLPQDRITEELAIIALKSDYTSFKYLPIDKYESVQKIAISYDYMYFKDISNPSFKIKLFYLKERIASFFRKLLLS